MEGEAQPGTSKSTFSKGAAFWSSMGKIAVQGIPESTCFGLCGYGCVEGPGNVRMGGPAKRTYLGEPPRHR